MRQYLTNEKGRKTAVVIPIKEYEQLLEDLHDLAIIAERRDNPRISLEELKSRLRANAAIPARNR